MRFLDLTKTHFIYKSQSDAILFNSDGFCQILINT